PWDTFESVFQPGSVHKCTIISKNDKGAVLELPYGIEGFATTKNLNKEDGSVAEMGENLEFRVLEFSKEDKRIVLSHTAVFSKTEDKPKASGSKGTAASGKSRTSDKPKGSGDGEKSTLGDLEALSALKEQMVEDQKQALDKKESSKKEKASASEEKDKAGEAKAASDEKDEDESKKTAKAEKAKVADKDEEGEDKA